ncbi:hypothetical protein EDC01DRAFT_744373 [Geopyxis carbonaria]|nr:hypothetical protein EDC01DRAFT_744373 [Geopyxis carbonaria]
MPDPIREHTIGLALHAINHCGYSMEQAAQEFNIPTSSLRHRKQKQALSNDQEEQLVNWILEQQAKGCTPTEAKICKKADDMASLTGKNRTSRSRNWVQRFRARNPKVAKKSMFDYVEEQEARYVVTKTSDYTKLRSNYDLFLEQRARLLAEQSEEAATQASEPL